MLLDVKELCTLKDPSNHWYADRRLYFFYLFFFFLRGMTPAPRDSIKPGGCGR